MGHDMGAEHQSAIIHHPDFLLYDFGPQHPLRPERITAGLDLLETSGLWNREQESIGATVTPEADLLRVHSDAFLRAVREADSGWLPNSALAEYGLSSRDNPAFDHMHYASALVAGGTI